MSMRKLRKEGKIILHYFRDRTGGKHIDTWVVLERLTNEEVAYLNKFQFRWDRKKRYLKHVAENLHAEYS